MHPTIKRGLMDAATADAVRSGRYAYHRRDWELRHGSPVSRLLHRWRGILARREHLVRRDQRVIDTHSRPSGFVPLAAGQADGDQ